MNKREKTMSKEIEDDSCLREKIKKVNSAV